MKMKTLSLVGLALLLLIAAGPVCSAGDEITEPGSQLDRQAKTENTETPGALPIMLRRGNLRIMGFTVESDPNAAEILAQKGAALARRARHIQVQAFSLRDDYDPSGNGELNRLPDRPDALTLLMNAKLGTMRSIQPRWQVRGFLASGKKLETQKRHLPDTPGEAGPGVGR